MNECNIVKDLIPLYADELASPDSVELIQRHTQHCPDCRRMWQRCRSDLPEIETPTPEQEARKIKRAIRRERLQTAGKTLLTVLIVLSIIASYMMLKFFEWGFLDPIETSISAPDGWRVLEIVEKDFLGNRGIGYMIRFNLKMAGGGINRYYTDWDEIEAHWAQDSKRLFLELVTVEGQAELRIIDTSEHHMQGGTYDIPDMTEDLIPILTGLCKNQPELPTDWETIKFSFLAWHDDSETVTLSYETDTGHQGTLDYHYPTEAITDIR